MLGWEQDELETIWKEAAMAESPFYPGTDPEELRKSEPSTKLSCYTKPPGDGVSFPAVNAFNSFRTGDAENGEAPSDKLPPPHIWL
jgi:hypothetical protein